MMDDVKEYMKEHSYFDLDDEENDFLIYSSRENGDVLNEEYGKEDLAHARSIVHGIYTLGYKVEIEPVDEFIILTISI